jgi:uncharacterized membrane protein YphA (DoxX/SURF4 family)
MSMNPQHKALRVTGLVLNVLIAALLIFAGGSKLVSPATFAEQLKTVGLEDKVLLLGVGELASGLLLLIPRTSPLGTLLVSGFWGGVICVSMMKHESFIFPSVLLLVTWIGSYLRGSVSLLRPKAPKPAA